MFPKIVWRYWEQGWDNAPFVVNHCTQSIKHYAQDFDIKDLDKNSVKDYINFPSFLQKKFDYPVQVRSDLIRLLLLKKYGGVWIDATVFLNNSLSSFLNNINSDFFMFFRDSTNDAPSNWFLCSKKDSYVCDKMLENFQSVLESDDFYNSNKMHFNKWKESPNYFVFHREIGKLKKTDENFRDGINSIPYFSSYDMLFPIAGYNYNAPVLHEIYDIICNKQIPMVKLSHSLKQESFSKEGTLGLLIKRMNNELTFNKYQKHIHSYLAMRSCRVYNSYIHKPEYMIYSGAFITEPIPFKDYPHYKYWHIINLNSHMNNAFQIAVPFGENRVFIRSQKNNKFTELRELAYQDQIAHLELRIKDLEKKYTEKEFEILWKEITLEIKNELPKIIHPSWDIYKNYFQFFITNCSFSIHYEIYKNKNNFFISLDLERELKDETKLIQTFEDIKYYLESENFNYIYKPHKFQIGITVNRDKIKDKLLFLINTTNKAIYYYFNPKKYREIRKIRMIKNDKQNNLERTIKYVYASTVDEKANDINFVFNSIYKAALWKNGSGSGSDPTLLSDYISFLQKFFIEHDIKSITDIGCGDWQYMSKLDLSKIKYTGYDVSKYIIEKVKKVYETNNIKFEYYDGDFNKIESADLAICKDVLQHLPLNYIQNFKNNLYKFKYALIVNDFAEISLNTDIKIGECRPLDLRKEPFFLDLEIVHIVKRINRLPIVSMLWKNNN